jgi:inner membrane protein
LIASVLPDLDLLYFFLVDQRQHNHHSYWPHIPAIWIGLFVLSFAVIKLLRKSRWLPYLFIFYFNILLHLLLDTLVGGIAWLYPFDAGLISLFTVPANESHWLLSFIWHWSFLVELLFIYVAANVFARSAEDTEVERAIADAATEKLVSADLS